MFEVVAGSGQTTVLDVTATSQTGPIATLTAPVADVTSPPSVVTVTFNAPIDPGTARYFDVLIEEQSGGSWVNAVNNTADVSESLDPTGTQLSLTLVQPLLPGSYRVVLPVSSGLYWASGGSVVNFSQDQVLGEFTVEQSALALGDASSLSSPAAGSVSVSGALDFQADPGAVNLYSFTLPAGHHWRLGADVLASSIGSPLLSDLTLFNAQGQVVATANTGLLADPADPYLFQGLDPGTYYIGISGAGNVPGTANGYNLATGQSASDLAPQTGGAYQLDLEADVADTPTQVLGVSLQYADPLDPHPTGFALAFSGPLNTQTLVGATSTGIELVNQNGQLFPIRAVAQQQTSAQYLFLADEDLPAGQYSIVVPDATQGGVTDLAGFTPVAAGQPAGVLATFNVSGHRDGNPYDLGVLYDNASSSVSENTVILPRTSVTYRFVVDFAGEYKFQILSLSGSLSIQSIAPGGVSTPINVGTPGQPTVTKTHLAPGVYYLQFQNVGLTPAILNWRLRDLFMSHTFEALLNNGVGQGPALNAMSIVGTASGLSGLVSTDSAWAGQPTAGATGGAVTVTDAARATVAPSGLWVTVGSMLVGRPSVDANHVLTVGPSSGTGSTALASNASGLLQGVVARTTNRLAPVNEFLDPGSASGTLETPLEPVNGALVASTRTPEPRPDETVIASADWLSRLGATAARWLALAPREALEPALEAPPETPQAAAAAPIALVRDDSPTAKTEDGDIERAHFGVPLVVGIAALMSVRSNPLLLRLLKRNRVATSVRQASIFRGPISRR